jgi:predicted membrane chloride channel (bestrophin family)
MAKKTQKTVTFNNPPLVVRALMQQWLNETKTKKDVKPAQIALMEDILQLIDIAMTILEPGPAEPGNDKK